MEYSLAFYWAQQSAGCDADPSSTRWKRSTRSCRPRDPLLPHPASYPQRRADQVAHNRILDFDSRQKSDSLIFSSLLECTCTKITAMVFRRSKPMPITGSTEHYTFWNMFLSRYDDSWWVSFHFIFSGRYLPTVSSFTKLKSWGFRSCLRNIVLCYQYDRFLEHYVFLWTPKI